MEKPVFIFGAKGLGSVALEIFKSNNVMVYGFLDDDKSLHGTEIDDTPVYGSTSDEGFTKLIGQKTEAFVASDDNKIRKAHVEFLIETRKSMPVNAVHNNATLSTTALIGHGNLIASGVKINSNAKVGNHCVINSGAIIDFDAEIEDFVQIGTGAIVNSNVKIEEGAFIGTGAVIVSGITIGKNAQIGAGSVVIASVPAKARVFGNPAEKV